MSNFVEIISTSSEMGQEGIEKKRIKLKNWAVLLSIVVKISASTCLADRAARVTNFCNTVKFFICISMMILLKLNI